MRLPRAADIRYHIQSDRITANGIRAPSEKKLGLEEVSENNRSSEQKQRSERGPDQRNRYVKQLFERGKPVEFSRFDDFFRDSRHRARYENDVITYSRPQAVNQNHPPGVTLIAEISVERHEIPEPYLFQKHGDRAERYVEHKGIRKRKHDDRYDRRQEEYYLERSAERHFFIKHVSAQKRNRHNNEIVPQKHADGIEKSPRQNTALLCEFEPQSSVVFKSVSDPLTGVHIEFLKRHRYRIEIDIQPEKAEMQYRNRHHGDWH